MTKRGITIVFTVFALLISLACSPFALLPETATPEVELTDEELTERIEAEVARQLAQQPEPVATTEIQGTIDTELEAVLTDLYRRANPAVVFIVVGSGSGSGFVYSDEGYIITNNHVIVNANEYEVVFADGSRQRAELIGTDVDSDLAVLQVDALPEDIEPLALAEPNRVHVGQFVVAIGNPFGEQGSMSLGIISGLGRSLPSQRGTLTGSTYSLPEIIQTDAPINPGNSGGPLLNLNGEVVGVNAAIATLSGSNSGVGFSIPIAAVRRIVPSLIEEGSYTYPYMGLAFDSEVTLDEASLYGLSQTQGAYVIEVVEDGPAEEAGIIAANPATRAGGDLIIALDGEPVNNFADLNSYLSFNTSVGETIQVTLLRESEEITLPLTLGARP